MQEIEKSPCSTMDICMIRLDYYRLCIIVFKSYSRSLSRRQDGAAGRPTIDHFSFSKSNRVLSAQPESSQRKLIPRARSKIRARFRCSCLLDTLNKTSKRYATIVVVKPGEEGKSGGVTETRKWTDNASESSFFRGSRLQASVPFTSAVWSRCKINWSMRLIN